MSDTEEVTEEQYVYLYFQNFDCNIIFELTSFVLFCITIKCNFSLPFFFLVFCHYHAFTMKGGRNRWVLLLPFKKQLIDILIFYRCSTIDSHYTRYYAFGSWLSRGFLDVYLLPLSLIHNNWSYFPLCRWVKDQAKVSSLAPKPLKKTNT